MPNKDYVMLYVTVYTQTEQKYIKNKPLHRPKSGYFQNVLTTNVCTVTYYHFILFVFFLWFFVMFIIYNLVDLKGHIKFPPFIL